jgi:hypothetical protein
MATHLGASTTNAEGTHRGHQACQAVPRPLDSLPTHTGVERKLPRSHGLQGCYPRSTARTSLPSKVYRAAPSPPFTDIFDAPALHHLRAQPPLRDCCCRTRPPSPGPTALRHEEGGGRGSSRGSSASHAPLVVPPPPTSCHRARSPHQPPPDPEGRRGKREQPRPNGLPGCPHTLHPPRRLRRPAATEGDRRADQPLQPEGETEEGGAVEANGGPPRLLSHPPRRHRHPTCSRRASAHRRPLPSSPAAEPPDPASLRRPPAGSSLLALPGAASPPHGSSPPKRTSPNRIYRPAARPAPSDLCPTRKNTPPNAVASAAPQEERGASPPPSLLAPAPTAARRRGRERRWRREGVGVTSRVASQTTQGPFGRRSGTQKNRC